MLAPQATRLMGLSRAALLATIIVAATLAFAQTPAPAPNDAALETRVKALTSELRCLVCQNQTVADSTSPVANDLRDQVRTQLAAGKSEDEVKTYMTDRFGDFVLYKPRFKATTFALWAGPFIVLALAGVLLVRRLRKSSATHQATVLTDIERERARALLRDDGHINDHNDSKK